MAFRGFQIKNKIRRLYLPIVLKGLLVGLPIYSQSGQEMLSSLLNTMNSTESFRANIVINGSSGLISYKKPHNLYIKFSDGRILSANGKHLWFYNPAKTIAGKQDLKGLTGGLNSLLSGYESVSARGNSIILESEKKAYEEITVTLGPNNFLRSIRLKPRGSSNFTELSLSGVQTNIGLPASIFNYHPPSSAQIVENPLNQRE
jgi:outer membrane lipoprotein carrier protein